MAKHPLFPRAIGALFVTLVVIAGGLSALVAKAGPDEAPAAKDPALAALTDGLAALKNEVAGLTKEIKDLRKKVESSEKPAPAPDLDKVNEKVAGFEKSLKSLQEGLSALAVQVAALKGDAPKTAASARPANDAPLPKPVDVDLEGQAMSQAVQLYKAGKYKEAGAIFKTVEDEAPKDARVWYYAAISRGMATNDWRGETEKLAKKGVEREKAGTPTAAEIDAEFADLADSVKSWLNFYRKTAK